MEVILKVTSRQESHTMFRGVSAALRSDASCVIDEEPGRELRVRRIHVGSRPAIIWEESNARKGIVAREVFVHRDTI